MTGEQLPTWDGTPAGTPGYGHAGLMGEAEILDRVRRGLPAYVPTMPLAIDQRRYVEFAGERGTNSD